MIFVYCPSPDPMLWCGLVPSEIAWLRAGKPLQAPLKTAGLDWTISLGDSGHLTGKESPQHLALFVGEAFLDKLQQVKVWQVPTQDKPLPFKLQLFFAESEDAAMAQLLDRGCTIETFSDDRGMVN